MQITKDGAIISRASVGDLLMTLFLECLSRGMTLPCTVCYVGGNGGVSVTRLSDLDSPMERLFNNAERIEPPINIMVIDRVGHSLKVTVTLQGEALQVSASDPNPHLH